MTDISITIFCWLVSYFITTSNVQLLLSSHNSGKTGSGIIHATDYFTFKKSTLLNAEYEKEKVNIYLHIVTLMVLPEVTIYFLLCGICILLHFLIIYLILRLHYKPYKCFFVGKILKNMSCLLSCIQKCKF